MKTQHSKKKLKNRSTRFSINIKEGIFRSFLIISSNLLADYTAEE